MKKKRNVAYENKFRSYLYSGSLDRYNEIIKGINADRGLIKKKKTKFLK